MDSPSNRNIIEDLDAIARARRLEELGFEIKSAELTEVAQSLRQFYESGGNRAMRRAAARAARSKRHAR